MSEELPGALDLGVLDALELQGREGALGLGDEVDVLDRSLREGDGPVGVVVADRGRDEEAARQLGVDRDLGAGVQFGDEVTLDLGVGDDVVVDVLLELLARLGEVLRRLVLREDRRVEAVLERVVRQVLDDDRGLLLVDQPSGFGDELLGVEPELGEGVRVDPAKDRGGGAPGELGLLRDLAEQVVLDLRPGRDRLGLGGRRGDVEPGATGQVVSVERVALLCRPG